MDSWLKKGALDDVGAAHKTLFSSPLVGWIRESFKLPRLQLPQLKNSDDNGYCPVELYEG